MRLHALVEDAERAREAIEAGATVIQLRLKGVGADELVERGRPVHALCRESGVAFVVNDDVQVALALGADGVHLGRSDEGAELAAAAGLLLGLSASSVEEARVAEERGAAYVGAGPVWETPSKADADPPTGILGLAEICRAVGLPVVAVGGIDASNAAACIRAGASGVAVVRAAGDPAVREAVDAAL